MTRRDYSESETRRMHKHLGRLERALKARPGELTTAKVSPARLAEFERHMSARNKMREGKQVAWALMHHAGEHAMNKLDWKKFDDARRTKKVRDAVKRKLGLKK